ncbi:class I SAM-dependent methyltransferase [Ktedonosporobacter rubrisoli]|uniref:Class I SAM-dependent methyltransferase n=1 Tax=Ktedonosporobacter rubrisoli TaxID=2509675 RepID=A0A4P6JPX9_KTERU|nr:class I SAM-dependent methyltransferase [Ktedonosporobacter rubrisoli]QBD77449.1 class I SAM-dependent methyltransferase [Ktedonosporobacter rubrisoli]
MSFLFKDTERAARRLQIVADVFAFSSRPFLQAVVGTAPEVAIDLGCGPGYTTCLLAEVSQCVRAIGLGSSEYFLWQAQRNAPTYFSFVRHDVTHIPFPTEPCDLIFCRLLLTHLQVQISVLERWGTQLRPQDLLLVEEVEWVRTEHPLLRRYLEIQTALFKQRGNELYIGLGLEQYRVNDGLRRCLSRVSGTCFYDTGSYHVFPESPIVETPSFRSAAVWGRHRAPGTRFASPGDPCH